MGILSFVKDKDLFGHKVKISFNGQGSQHKTYVGGFFSIMVKSFMIVFVTNLLIKLITKGEDSIFTITSQQNASDLEDVNLLESGF